MFWFIITTNNGVLVKKVTSENVKTTTLEETSDLKKAINNVYDSTVYIQVTGDRGVSASGSGFVYKTDDKYGYVLTNYHVIDDGKKFVVTFSNGKDIEASLVSGDEYYDIAVLKVDKDSVIQVATLGDLTRILSSPAFGSSTPPLNKNVTCAYFSV